MATRLPVTLFRARTSGLDIEPREGGLRIAVPPEGASAAIIEEVRTHSAGLNALLRRHATELADGGNFLSRFERTADRFPQRVALRHGQTAVTYCALRRHVDRLALRLAQSGVSTETRVGLMCPRGEPWIAAMIAIMKSGGAYLALGTHLPPPLTAQYCRDGHVEVLLGSSELLDEMESLDIGKARALRLDPEPDAAAPAQATAFHPPHPRQLAYVIMTSGSTGAPKFVAIEHSALDHFVSWFMSEYELDCGEVRTTQMSTETFDAHILEIMPSLAAGATLHILDDADRLDSRILGARLRQGRITHCFMTTPIAEEFAEANATEAFPDLRHLLMGGDVLRRRLPPRWPFELINLYGPTESTVVATHAYLRTDSAEVLSPVGLAIEGTTAQVLDEDLQCVRDEQPGELYLSGPSLARGYLGNPRETAVRFTPDPQARLPGARRYRTGDLALRRPDHQLQVVGRVDRQMKVRGIRVEPAAIEAVMLEHHAVRDAAVIVHPDLPDALMGFCTLHPSTQHSDNTDVDEWRALYEGVYGNGPGALDDEFVGWRSSFDGQAIPYAEMLEWASATARRVLECVPRRVLEIGCGTGILLFRVLHALQDYVGMDMARHSLDIIRGRLHTHPGHAHRVSLFELAAHELGQLPPGEFDTIVLNSVVQYFPDKAYLECALEDALARLAPGGTLFIGDVRDLRLAEAFAGRVLTHGNSDELLQERLRMEVDQEEELLLSPELFLEWARQHERVQDALIQPKESTFDNEMTRFRFDITIRTRCSESTQAPPVELEVLWKEIGTTAAALESFLRETSARSVHIREIPLAPVCHDIAAIEALRASFAQCNASRSSARGGAFAGELRPIEAVEAGLSAGLRARVFLNGERPGHFGLQLSREPLGWPRLPESPACRAPTSNDPTPHRRERRLLSALRDHLRRRLPDYLVPGRLLRLAEMPVTSSGKIDRAALASRPLPLDSLRSRDAPVTAGEKLVARWFANAFNLPAVGRHDNLFDLGGQSLLAMRLAAQISEATGIDFPVYRILQQPTVLEIARELEIQLGGSETAARIFGLLEQQYAALAPPQVPS